MDPAGHYKGEYLVLSAHPPIIYACDWALKWRKHPVNRILWALRNRRAWVIVRLSWTHEQRPEAVAGLRRRFADGDRQHRYIFACNTPAEVTVFRRHGLNAFLCSHNAFSDERIYRPIAGAIRRHDAIYDARLSRFKRHLLATEVRSLSLITKFVPEPDVEEYRKQVRRALGHAHWFNDPFLSDFRVLGPEAVNDCLNQCRVGLCLSAEEGAMCSSIQYLLAGLPVVSTPNLGGRDLFFEEQHVKIVTADAKAVADGVREMSSKDIDPAKIRRAALSKVMTHRRRLMGLVQDIYDEAGVDRCFEQEWPKVFRNYLLDPFLEAHEVTLSLFRAGSPGPRRLR